MSNHYPQGTVCARAIGLPLALGLASLSALLSHSQMSIEMKKSFPVKVEVDAAHPMGELRHGAFALRSACRSSTYWAL
jgi:hypothetical protein